MVYQGGEISHCGRCLLFEGLVWGCYNILAISSVDQKRETGPEAR